MKSLPSLSIFFPVLNDSKSIPFVLRRAYAAATRVTGDFEVFFVDDGSSDETRAVLRQLRRHYVFGVVRHEHTRGYGAALRTGFSRATKRFVFYTDGDGQYDPYELLSLVRVLTPQIDVVNGFKRYRSDPWLRRLVGSAYNFLVHQLVRLPIRDVDCDFRLIRMNFLKRLVFSSSSGAIGLELVRKLGENGATFAEVPVSHYPRLYGRSEFFRGSHLVSSAREFFRVLS